MTDTLPTWALALTLAAAALVFAAIWGKTRGKTDDITDLEDRI